MCGIVGILGQHQAAPILLDGLKRLEYRGYDSAGVATLNQGRLERRRAVGKLVNLADLLVHRPLAGTAGIGHTRWATHGAPTVINAHPHQTDKVAVVHNGIIENFKELRQELELHQLIFESDTDTEIIVKICQKYISSGLSPNKAAQATLKHLKGSYALCFLFDGYPDLLIAATHGSPLAIGYGDNEMFIGSDAIALSPLTNKIVYLQEGDCAIISRANVTIIDEIGNTVARKIHKIDTQASIVDKGVHKHFMAKEIAEQPVVIAESINRYTDIKHRNITINIPDINLSAIDNIVMIGCGTAYLACYVAKYWFEQIAGLATHIDFASEFRYCTPPLYGKAVAIFVSQSGETADTLAALRHCKERALPTIGIVNVMQSSIARLADISLPIHAGVEIGVASTKAFTCQLTILLMLAIKIARMHKRLDDAKHTELLSALSHLPKIISAILNSTEQIIKISRILAKYDNALFIGRGMLYPIALEAALKLKEISYIHAEGYAGGELKHGPIALVDENMPIIIFAPNNALFDKIVSNMQEVLARGSKVVLITDSEGAKIAGNDVWKLIIMPKMHPILTSIAYALPAQLLAYYTAVAKGTDIDQPRNLAKSVTVE